MAVANLILEYIKALIWPVTFVLALVMVRQEVPALLRRLRTVKVMGVETEFGVVEVVASVGTAFNAAQTGRDEGHAATKRPVANLTFDESAFWETRKSRYRVLLNLRFRLIDVVKQLDAAYGLDPLTAERGVRLDVPVEPLIASIRRLASVTEIDAWSQLADAVIAMHQFVDQTLDDDLAKRTLAVLAPSALATCKELALQSVRSG